MIPAQITTTLRIQTNDPERGSFSIPVLLQRRDGGPTDWDYTSWHEFYWPGVAASTMQLDPDRDGASNYDEWLAGTHPLSPNDAMRFTEADTTPSATEHQLSWPSVAGRTYSILRATSPVGPFVPIRTNIAATPPLNSETITVGSPIRGTFYCIEATTINP
jgi:hypothetical protein